MFSVLYGLWVPYWGATPCRTSKRLVGALRGVYGCPLSVPEHDLLFWYKNVRPYTLYRRADFPPWHPAFCTLRHTFVTAQGGIPLHYGQCWGL